VLPAATDTSSHMVENKRKVFMTEKEKKEQLILKQRAELALKKGTAELPAEVERRIELEVLASLQEELEKLLVDDTAPHAGHGKDAKVPLPRSHAGAVVSKTRLFGGPDSPLGKKTGASSQGAASGGSGAGGTEKARRRMSHTKYKDGNRTYDAAKMNIDDLFDIFINSNEDHEINVAYSDDGSDAGRGDKQDEVAVSNEFADELLYMMRTAMSLT
jgi:hypothetical protein